MNNASKGRCVTVTPQGNKLTSKVSRFSHGASIFKDNTSGDTMKSSPSSSRIRGFA